MNLRDLDASLVTRVRGSIGYVDRLDDAHGLLFQCPKCAEGKPVSTNGASRFVQSVHYVICWFEGRVVETILPGPVRYTPTGRGIDDLTLHPSVEVHGGCRWHGVIKDGQAR